MKAKLKTLPDKLRGAAWPSSARAVSCQVKSCNERDPCLYLLTLSPERVHYRGTARVKWEEGAGNGRSVWPECSGLHATYKGQNNGSLLRKETLISKSDRSPD